MIRMCNLIFLLKDATSTYRNVKLNPTFIHKTEHILTLHKLLLVLLLWQLVIKITDHISVTFDSREIVVQS